jgi:hypothetical protein
VRDLEEELAEIDEQQRRAAVSEQQANAVDKSESVELQLKEAVAAQQHAEEALQEESSQQEESQQLLRQERERRLKVRIRNSQHYAKHDSV